MPASCCPSVLPCHRAPLPGDVFATEIIAFRPEHHGLNERGERHVGRVGGDPAAEDRTGPGRRVHQVLARRKGGGLSLCRAAPRSPCGRAG